MIKSIIATFECDNCGKEFSATIDPAYTPPNYWCLMDIAENAVLAKGEEIVKNNRHFCETCSDDIDKGKLLP